MSYFKINVELNVFAFQCYQSQFIDSFIKFIDLKAYVLLHKLYTDDLNGMGCNVWQMLHDFAQYPLSFSIKRCQTTELLFCYSEMTNEIEIEYLFSYSHWLLNNFF